MVSYLTKIFNLCYTKHRIGKVIGVRNMKRGIVDAKALACYIKDYYKGISDKKITFKL